MSYSLAIVNAQDAERLETRFVVGSVQRMASVLDVAQDILQRQGAMTAMKLQKLCYYAQAWHLVWDEQPLFPEPIQAWANGPVAPALYAKHRGRYGVEQILGGRPARLSPSEVETIDAILDFYGNRGGAELSELTHREAPWRQAREGTAPGEFSRQEITHVAMAEYYEGLLGTSADK